MKFTPEQVKEAIKGTGGIKTAIAKRLSCERGTVDDYLKRDPELKAAYDSEKESVLDFAETKLISQMQSGNMTALIFYLKCQGKARGYVEKSYTEVSGQLAIPDLSKVGEAIKQAMGI